MSNRTRYLVFIDKEKLSVHRQGQEVCFFERNSPELFPDSFVYIKDKQFPLSELSKALNTYIADWIGTYLDERGQIDVGQHLYRQIFGDRPYYELERDAKGVEIRIISDDEDVCNLPWALLADKGVFLVTTGWVIFPATGRDVGDKVLPSRAKILVIAPQPLSWSETMADDHIKDFQDMLSESDIEYGDEKYFRVVKDYHSFRKQLTEFKPEILYYYGHGTGNRHTSRLLFEGRNQKPDPRPFTDIAAAIRNLPDNKRPALVYFNCCQGDSGGLLGAGLQLIDLVPAVLTNRTTAFIKAARPQALGFWEAVLLQGEDPGSAITFIRSGFGDLDLSTADIRWMTPVLHCAYDNWISTKGTAIDRSIRDPHWHLKVDRKNQFALVAQQVRYMLREGKPKGHSFLWYGHPEQGMNIFHRRLAVELQEDLVDVEVIPVYPQWPDDMHNPHRSFSDMICQALEISSLEHVTVEIRAQSSQTAGIGTLVYLCHTPLQSPKRFHPTYIDTYLTWWADQLLPRLPENSHAVLGMSYETMKPKHFRQLFDDEVREKIDSLDLHNAAFEILDELTAVDKNDLHTFVRTHSIRIPSDIKNKVLDDILDDSKESYFRLLDELRRLEIRAYRESIKKDQSPKGKRDDPWKGAF